MQKQLLAVAVVMLTSLLLVRADEKDKAAAPAGGATAYEGKVLKEGDVLKLSTKDGVYVLKASDKADDKTKALLDKPQGKLIGDKKSAPKVVVTGTLSKDAAGVETLLVEKIDLPEKAAKPEGDKKTEEKKDKKKKDEKKEGEKQ